MTGMKKLLQDTQRKLRGRAGDSIAEVLVALLISAVALVMLASMISASSRIIQRSRNSLEAYYDQNNVLTMQQTEGTLGKAKFTYSETGYIEYGTIKYVVNDKLSGRTVVAYWE